MKIDALLKILKECSTTGRALTSTELWEGVEPNTLPQNSDDTVEVKVGRHLTTSELILLYSFYNAERNATDNTITLLFGKYSLKLELYQWWGIIDVVEQALLRLGNEMNLTVHATKLPRIVTHRLVCGNEYENPIHLEIEGVWMHGKDIVESDDVHGFMSVHTWTERLMSLRVHNSGIRYVGVTIEPEPFFTSPTFLPYFRKADPVLYRALDVSGHTKYICEIETIMQLVYLVHGKEPEKLNVSYDALYLIEKIDDAYRFNHRMFRPEMKYLDLVALLGPTFRERLANAANYISIIEAVNAHVDNVLRSVHRHRLHSGRVTEPVFEIICKHLLIDGGGRVSFDVDATYHELLSEAYLTKLADEDLIAGVDKIHTLTFFSRNY